MLPQHFKSQQIKVVGIVASSSFQNAKFCAVQLAKAYPKKFLSPVIQGLLEFDWNEQLLIWKRTLGGKFWRLERPVAVFVDGEFIGNDEDLLKTSACGNILLNDLTLQKNCKIHDPMWNEYLRLLKKDNNCICFLDISIDNVMVGSLTFKLFAGLLPKTCEHFRSLCLGLKGPSRSYKGTLIHRVVKKCWIQGGGTGRGCLVDENYAVKHTRRGVLSLVNHGRRHTNGSEFLVTLQSSPWMDGKYVAFGQLTEGARVLDLIEKVATDLDRPLQKIQIVNCGVLDLKGDDTNPIRQTESPPVITKSKKNKSTLAEDVLSYIIEMVAEDVRIRDQVPDIIDEQDWTSTLNINFYFQGKYSLSDDVLESTGKFIRQLRRLLMRDLKPISTDVVEVIMWDVLEMALARTRVLGTNLDEVRGTLDDQLYNSLVERIRTEMDVNHVQVRAFVDEVVTTAEDLIEFIVEKTVRDRDRSKTRLMFEDRIQSWLRSFVLQEFGHQKLQKQNMESRRTEQTRVHLDALQSHGDTNRPQPRGAGVASHIEPECKNKPTAAPPQNGLENGSSQKKKKKDQSPTRMPFLDFLAYQRLQLNKLRKQKKRFVDRTIADGMKRWLQEVVYTPETDWIRDTIMEKGYKHPDHVEEMMLGALTLGLIEIYYLADQKVTRTGNESSASSLKRNELLADFSNEDLVKIRYMQSSPRKVTHPEWNDGISGESSEKKEVSPGGTDVESSGREEVSHALLLPTTSKVVLPSEHADDKSLSSGISINTNDDKSLNSEILIHGEIDLDSLEWMKCYILDKGNHTKSNFSRQVHLWLEGSTFCYTDLPSKHSLVSRTSLLNLSLSIAGLIKNLHLMGVEIRDFVYDLWELYFKELILNNAEWQQCSSPVKGPKDNIRKQWGRHLTEQRIASGDNDKEVHGDNIQRARGERGCVMCVDLLTELTKQALNKMAAFSRLPHRLYFTTDSEQSFHHKTACWLDFNKLHPYRPKPRDILEYIDTHQVKDMDLNRTARSYLRKKVNSDRTTVSADAIKNLTQQLTIDQTLETQVPAQELNNKPVTTIFKSTSILKTVDRSEERVRRLDRLKIEG